MQARGTTSSPPRDELAGDKKRKPAKEPADTMIRRANPVVCSHCIDSFDRAPTDTRTPRRVVTPGAADSAAALDSAKKQPKWGASQGSISSQHHSQSHVPQPPKRPQSAKVVGSPKGKPAGQQQRRRPQTARERNQKLPAHHNSAAASAASRPHTPRLMKGFTRWELESRGVQVAAAPPSLVQQQQQHITTLAVSTDSFDATCVIAKTYRGNNNGSSRPHSAKAPATSTTTTAAHLRRMKASGAAATAAALCADEELDILDDDGDGDEEDGWNTNHPAAAAAAAGEDEGVVMGRTVTPSLDADHAMMHQQQQQRQRRPQSARVVEERALSRQFVGVRLDLQQVRSTTGAATPVPSVPTTAARQRPRPSTAGSPRSKLKKSTGPMGKVPVHEARGMRVVSPRLQDPQLYRNWRPSPRNEAECQAATRRATSPGHQTKAASAAAGEKQTRTSPPRNRTPSPQHGDREGARSTVSARASPSRASSSSAAMPTNRAASSMGQQVLRLHRQHMQRRRAAQHTYRTTKQSAVLADTILLRCDEHRLRNRRTEPRGSAPMATYGPKPRCLRTPVTRPPDTVLL